MKLSEQDKMIHLRVPESLRRRINIVVAKKGTKVNPELLPVIERWVEQQEAELNAANK